MEPAGEGEPRQDGGGEADLLRGGELSSPGERGGEPGLSSPRCVSFTTASELSFRSSSIATEYVEDDDMMYRLMQSECEEIPSFRWIPSPLRWWKTKQSRRIRPGDASGESSRAEKPAPVAKEPAESDGETKNELAHFHGNPVYALQKLEADKLVASAVLSARNTSGTEYSSTVLDGTRVTVKKLAIDVGMITREKFEDEVNVLGRIRHPNLLPLRAYYFSRREKLLVFDCRTLGSLSSVLHARDPDLPTLGWPTRMNIAIGVAKGLHYLHTQENMVHGNLTSGSILLDDRANAKIADYAVPNSRTAVGGTIVAPFGPFGYRPPKFSKFSRANIKTDVYSFGVIMLEILTGNSPWEAINGLGLLQWVTSVLEEGRTQEVFDQELMRDAMGTVGNDLLDALYLALRCVDPWPYGRPEMLQVLQQLEKIKQEIVGVKGVYYGR